MNRGGRCDFADAQCLVPPATKTSVSSTGVAPKTRARSTPWPGPEAAGNAVPRRTRWPTGSVPTPSPAECRARRAAFPLTPCWRSIPTCCLGRSGSIPSKNSTNAAHPLLGDTYTSTTTIWFLPTRSQRIRCRAPAGLHGRTPPALMFRWQ